MKGLYSGEFTGFYTRTPRIIFFEETGPVEINLDYNSKIDKANISSILIELRARLSNFSIPDQDISEKELVSMVIYHLGMNGWESINQNNFRKQF